MDLQWLDDVLVLLEEGNMTRAAARRNITQPAFSRRIRSFEDWLGVQVLERGKNRVEISAALLANEGEIRALMRRIRDLRTKVADHERAAATVSIAGQHAPVSSSFPDMALRARAALPGIRFRVHARNLSECLTLFLRGDTEMLLCHEAESAAPLQFGAEVRRGVWGHDYLIPVVGGALRYKVRDGQDIPADTPAITYPDSSYFGEVLGKTARPFATAAHSRNPICETAFSTGAREMIAKGLGVGWLPISMIYRELESGEMISLANRLGREVLTVAIYATQRDAAAIRLLEHWSARRAGA